MNEPRDLERLTTFLAVIESHVYPEGPSKLHEDITRQALEHLKECYQPTPYALVLDIGCGQGPALRHFERWGVRAIGITLSDQDVVVCRAQGFTVAKMDQSFLDFDKEVFDVVWARHVLEHSIFPLFTLWEYHRVMKPGAILYVEVPAPETDCHHERNPNHYSLFSRAVWRQLLQRTGFLVVEETCYRFSVDAGDDEYWGFYCRKARSENRIQRVQHDE